MITRTSALGFLPMLWASVLAGCESHSEANAPEPVRPVLTAPVEVSTSKVFGPFTGTIEPRYSSDLGFQIGGRVIARDVWVGDPVKKGQRLALLDPALIQFQLASAEAELASAQAQFVNAQAEEGRKKKLLQTGVSPQAQIDTAVSALAGARGRLEQAKARLDGARIQLGFTSLAANFDGVVTAVSAEVGRVVSAGQTVVTVARPDVREAMFDVPDSLLDHAQQDGTYSVTLLADPTVTTTGKVREIAPLSDSATRTRRIRLSLDNPPNGFRLGSTVSISLSEPTAPQTVVPKSALLDDSGGDWVWVADATTGKVRKVAVKVVERRNDHAVVVANLSPGDRIVTAGTRSLHDGETIRVE
jgi:RND family efflux transporter MFP subunit